MQLSESVASSQAAGHTKFSALLSNLGLIGRDDLATAEALAARDRVELADAVVSLHFLSEGASYSALAASAGVPQAPDDMRPSELAVSLVPERLARRHLVVPIAVDNRTLTYATCQPFSTEADSDLGFASGRRTSAMVATRSAIVKALDRCYPKVVQVDTLAERLRGEGDMARPAGPRADAAAFDLCNDLLCRAVDTRASEVRMECGGRGATIRYRVSGVLGPELKVGATLAVPLRERFKAMASVGAAGKNRPQTGAFRLDLSGRVAAASLSVQATPGGEMVVIQIVDQRPPVASAVRRGPRRKSRVLVADDDSTTRIIVRRLLERADFDVFEAKNGDEAVGVVESYHPDLVLLDLNMPVMDGYEALHHLRRNTALARVPIIVITAESGESVERRVLAMGAEDYMTKPFEAAVVLSRINAVFNRLKMRAC